MSSSLDGLRVLDLSRVLAGPVCTQVLGDLGADIIKIEKPGAGDDTRQWGPPYLKDKDGNDTTESAYYLSCNRNKRSVSIDISRPEGQDLLRQLAARSDVLIENFKVGGLEKYGLGYEQLRRHAPRLVYCAISGFGQTGPLASEPGYDFIAQAMSGLMASTGEPGGQPMKAGVALSDVMTGLYGAIGILAALRHRDSTGEGQMVDLSLLDVSVAGMTNIAQYYLTAGEPAPRMGNAHATIVPYQTFPTRDGHVVIAVGNNTQFSRLCGFIGRAEWSADPRFSTNRERVRHRAELCAMLSDIFRGETTAYWVDGLRGIDVPAGPVNTIEQVFADDQIGARGMRIAMPHPYAAGPVPLVGSPLKLSAAPVRYDRAPPVCGQHTGEVLREILGLSEDAIQALKDGAII